MKLSSSKYTQQDLLELFKLRLFYISALFIATAEITDLFLIDFRPYILITNSLVAAISLLTIVLYRKRIISLLVGNSIVVYIMLTDILYSSYSRIGADNYESYFLRLTIVVCALIPYAAFTVNKYHSISVGTIYYLYYLLTLFLTGNSFLIKSIAVVTFVLIALVMGIYILTDNLMAAIENQNILLKKRDDSNKILVEQRKRLMETVESKNKLFSIISHDLKNPFNALLGFSKIMQSALNKGDTNALKRYNTLLTGSAERAYNLVLNLLDWSMAERNTLPFVPRNIQIAKVVDQVIELVQHDSERKEILINQNIPRNFIVYADKNMMDSIFRNLITNAIKFTKNKGVITIEAKDFTTYKLLSVKDTGKGMSQKAMSKLFTDTQIQSEPGTENEEGSGLGLSICKEFVNQHQGEIWVEKNPDMGLTFFISLPNVAQSG